MLFGKKSQMPTAEEALPGRADTMRVPDQHFVNFHPLTGPFPEGLQSVVFGLGCFWGDRKSVV